jgi:hypothetical protein
MQGRCMVCAKCNTTSESRFGRTRWNSKVAWVIWILIFVNLEIVLVSVQDRCTVCAKHTASLEIVLDAPDGTP